VHADCDHFQADLQKLKGRVVVADWSVAKHDFTPEQQSIGKDAKERETAHEAVGSPASTPDAAVQPVTVTTPAKAPGSVEPHLEQSKDTGTQARAAQPELDKEEEDAAAMEVRPEEKQLYARVLDGLLAGGSAQQARTGEPRGAGRAAKRGEPSTATRECDEGRGAQISTAAAWEGEKSSPPEKASDASAGVIQRQVFVRNLPLDALSSELSARMQHYGKVKACRCGALWPFCVHFCQGALCACTYELSP
jgi:hypothetical protein